MLYEDDFQDTDDELLTDIPDEEDEETEDDDLGAEEEDEGETY